jgi:hypothetical protein
MRWSLTINGPCTATSIFHGAFTATLKFCEMGLRNPYDGTHLANLSGTVEYKSLLGLLTPSSIYANFFGNYDYHESRAGFQYSYERITPINYDSKNFVINQRSFLTEHFDRETMQFAATAEGIENAVFCAGILLVSCVALKYVFNKFCVKTNQQPVVNNLQNLPIAILLFPPDPEERMGG